MSKITIDRAVFEQALEAHIALRDWVKSVPENTPLPAMPGMDGDWLATVLESMREALVQPAQEPVVLMALHDINELAHCNGMSVFVENPKIYPPYCEGEPLVGFVPLYTSPPARKPLTDDSDRLDWLMRTISGVEFRRIGVYCAGNVNREDIDSAIEAANGIKP